MERGSCEPINILAENVAVLAEVVTKMAQQEPYGYKILEVYGKRLFNIGDNPLEKYKDEDIVAVGGRYTFSPIKKGSD